MKSMIVVEEDDDLVACVARYFRDRFDVLRAATLEEALITLRASDDGILFADIGSHAPDDLSVVERIRQDHPRARIILTYLTPPNCERWSKRAAECSNILIRKPYRLLDVDRVMRDWSGTDGA